MVYQVNASGEYPFPRVQNYATARGREEALDAFKEQGRKRAEAWNAHLASRTVFEALLHNFGTEPDVCLRKFAEFNGPVQKGAGRPLPGWRVHFVAGEAMEARLGIKEPPGPECKDLVRISGGDHFDRIEPLPPRTATGYCSRSSRESPVCGVCDVYGPVRVQPGGDNRPENEGG